jgi:PHD/YefM family antitoxin component YafN of YafNO toxin-antitoxin module
MIIDKGAVVMPQIRPITDLRNTTEISEMCHAKREPVFITKNGYGDLVIMSIEAYEDMVETAHIDAAISEAEREFAADGVLLDAREALAALRRKHLG